MTTKTSRTARETARGNIFREDWVINKDNKGIRWAVVYLLPDPPKAGSKLPIHPSLLAVPGEPAVLDQPCCRFDPHVLAVRQGQPVEARNSSKIAHNVKWTGFNNPGGNVTLPPGGKMTIKDLKAAPSPVRVDCNIHPWMKAYLFVFDHPYYAVTDENGQFEIKLAPAGNHRLVIWQDMGWKDGNRTGTPITIKADEVMDVGKIELKPR